jgi:hypothetical protein
LGHQQRDFTKERKLRERELRVKTKNTKLARIVEGEQMREREGERGTNLQGGLQGGL